MANKEAGVLSKLKHQFIVRYLDNFKDSLGQFCIVMEYCDKGTLEDWLTSRSVKPLEEFNIWRLVRMISSALSFLHSQHPPIIHNDLMPANILCQTNPKYPESENTDIKIADFGVCNVPGKIWGNFNIIVHTTHKSVIIMTNFYALCNPVDPLLHCLYIV